MEKESNCIFCSIIQGKIPSFKVFEDETVFVFMDIHPITKGHMLVIPKKHAQYLCELTEKEAGHLLKIGQKMNALVRKILKCDDVSMHISDGKHAGQEVPHVHLHVIPRYKDDGFGFKFPDNYKDPVDIKKVEDVYKVLKDENP